MDVLFIRYRAFAPGETEWAEPIAVCCAFECKTTLLLLDAAAATSQHVEATLAELVALDIAAIRTTAPNNFAAVAEITAGEARELIHSHTHVLTA